MAAIRARVDVYGIEPGEATNTWQIKAFLKDPTGSFTPEDVESGDYIIFLGINTSGEFVYDKYVITGINGWSGDNMEFTLAYQEADPPLGMAAQPMTGSYPLVGEVLDIYVNPLSFYILQLDPHFEAAIDFFNLVGHSGNLQLVDWGTFYEDTTRASDIAPGFLLKTINIRNNGPAITLVITRLDDNYEMVMVDILANQDLTNTVNIPGIAGDAGIRISSPDWTSNVRITASIENIF